MARDADMAVVYYAGHGIELDGTNYLIPVDAALETDADVLDETLPLDRVLFAVEPAKLHGHQVAGAAQGHAHGAAGVDDEQARGRGIGRVGAGGQGQQRQVEVGHGAGMA